MKIIITFNRKKAEFELTAINPELNQNYILKNELNFNINAILNEKNFLEKSELE